MGHPGGGLLQADWQGKRMCSEHNTPRTLQCHVTSKTKNRVRQPSEVGNTIHPEARRIVQNSQNRSAEASFCLTHTGKRYLTREEIPS